MDSDHWDEKAREWLVDEACDYCSDIRLNKHVSLAALLRSVADEARREEAEEWGRVLSDCRLCGNSPEAIAEREDFMKRGGIYRIPENLKWR